jgi:hypothetical protein
MQVFLEPLKKVQVEGYVMCAEPEVLFGNLDELCCVSISTNVTNKSMLLCLFTVLLSNGGFCNRPHHKTVFAFSRALFYVIIYLVQNFYRVFVLGCADYDSVKSCKN